MSDAQARLIVYACPIGPLADQIDKFYVESKRTIGPNTAHEYMPHISLVGFFKDDLTSIPTYTDALAAALERARPTQPATTVEIEQVVFQPDFHGLVLRSPWLEALIADFCQSAQSPTRLDRIRPKSGLHLSLAYGFPASQAACLEQLARKMVDVTTPVRWELRLYQQLKKCCWKCHACWSLD